jgi:hypothetical protein
MIIKIDSQGWISRVDTTACEKTTLSVRPETFFDFSSQSDGRLVRCAPSTMRPASPSGSRLLADSPPCLEKPNKVSGRTLKSAQEEAALSGVNALYGKTGALVQELGLRGVPTLHSNAPLRQ